MDAIKSLPGAATNKVETSIPRYIAVGKECFVDGDPHKRVIVKFVGWTKFNTKGTWIGVAYDEPIGKHGGLVQGERYFTCKPKHGVFLRPNRLTPTPSGRSPTNHQSLPTSRCNILPQTTVSARGRSAPQRCHPTLERPKVGNAKTSTRRQIRYYVDPQGRRFTTLKKFDPYGRPTRVVGEDDDPASSKDLALLEARIKVEKDQIREAALRAESTAAAAAATAAETFAEANAETRRLGEAVNVLREAERARIVEDERRRADATLREEATAKATADAVAAAEARATAEANARAIAEARATDAARAAAEATAAAEASARAAAEVSAKATSALRKKRVSADPSSTGLSEDEDDGREELDAEVDAWFRSKIRSKAAGGPEVAGSFVTKTLTTCPPASKSSSLATCRDLARELKMAAIAEKWGEVRDLLVDRAVELVVTEAVLKASGVGKVVGKLRKAPNPGVVFAAEEVIEGWKFQISLDTSNNGADRSASRLPGDISPISQLRSTPTPERDTESSDSTFITRVAQRAGLVESTTAVMQVEKIAVPIQLEEMPVISIEDSDDTLTGTESEDEEDFASVSTLDQCVAYVNRIKILISEKKWSRLHRLLRQQISNLIVTEDDLRRSGIGRALAKVVKRSEDPALKLLAQDIISDWKDKVNHRDPEEERALENERIEREKFQQFMNLAPVSLGVESSECTAGANVHGVGESGRRSNKPVYYEKSFVLERGLRRKPLGFDVTIGSPSTGGSSAVVGKVEDDGLAARAAREGCSIEVGDEVVSVNGTALTDCTRDETIALFKAAKVSLVLRAIVPGSEIGDTEDEAKDDHDLYSMSGLPMFHKVLPSDLVALA